jgi:hypothetical protein
MELKIKIKAADGSSQTSVLEEDVLLDINFGFGASGLCRLTLEGDTLVIDPWSYGEE